MQRRGVAPKHAFAYYGLVIPRAYHLRAARRDELGLIAGLVQRVDREFTGFSEFDVDHMQRIATSDRFELVHDTWLVFHDDEPVACAVVWDSEPNRMFYGFGVVVAEHRGHGLGSELVRQMEARARVRAQAEATLRVWAEMHDVAAKELLERRGFVFVRRNWSMLGGPDPSVRPRPPRGIAIRSARGRDELRLFHDLLEETFADHWGHVARTYEEFEREVLASEHFDLTMWFVAEAADGPLGILMGDVVDDIGWVDVLGVRKEWRKRGLGEALLRHSFRDFAARGLNKVGLGVDTGNETGAVALYERVGLRAARGDDCYEKILG